MLISIRKKHYDYTFRVDQFASVYLTKREDESKYEVCVVAGCDSEVVYEGDESIARKLHTEVVTTLQKVERQKKVPEKFEKMGQHLEEWNGIINGWVVINIGDYKGEDIEEFRETIPIEAEPIKEHGKSRVEIYHDIDKEREYQDSKWGKNQQHYLAEWMLILGEEYGEVVKEACELTAVHSEGAMKRLKHELIQMLAVGVQILEKI